MTTAGLDARIDRLCNLHYRDLPTEVISRTQCILTDTVAVTAFGADAAPLLRMADAAPHCGPSTTFAPGLAATTMESATLLNAAAAVWNELDEGLRGAGHPAAHAVSAALAAAQHSQTTGRNLLTAVVAGYEMQAVLGHEFSLAHRVHPHGSFGAPAAALAAATALGLTSTQRRSSVSIAASMTPAALWEACTEGTDVRHFYAGTGARAGVTAALLAAAGVNAPRDAIQLAFGEVLGKPSKRPPPPWSVLQGYVKRWPSCAFTHTTLDVIEELRHEIDDVTNIRNINVAVPAVGVSVATLRTTTPLAIRFSIPALVGILLADGRVPRHLHPEQISSRARDLAQKTTVVEDKTMTDQWPRHMPSRVIITMQNHGTHQAELDDPWQPDGSLERFVTSKCRALNGKELTAQIRRFATSLPVATNVRREWGDAFERTPICDAKPNTGSDIL